MLGPAESSATNLSQTAWFNLSGGTMLKRTTTAAALSALMWWPAVAHVGHLDSMTTVQLAQKTPRVTEATRTSTLTDAASINEDLIGFALEGKVDKVAEKVAMMRDAHPTLRPLLDDTTFDALGRQVTDMEQASSKNDVLGTALVAVEVYRTIENAMGAAHRASPIEVAMMDYSGFKLSILAALPALDWATIATTAKEADRSWSALVKQVQDVSIRNLVGAVQDGLRSALERKDVHGVTFAAKMQLEVVDVLEQYFKRAQKTGTDAAR
jgi:hypothetical protein